MILVVKGALIGVLGLGYLGHRWKNRHAPPPPPPFALSPATGNRLEVTPSTPRATVGGKTYFFEDEEQQRVFILKQR